MDAEVAALKDIIELLRWALAVASTLMVGMIGAWWRVESGQNKKIDDGFEHNEYSHDKLFRKIDETKDDLTDQHLVLRDKIEEIWKYISQQGDNHGSRKPKA
jgi:hypothetical protein